MLQGGLRIQGKIKKPLVSIVTVVFNGGDFLEFTIKSVIQQNFVDFEYIIVDGGSTDATLSILKKYEDHIDYWISEADRGIYDAMNKAIDLANGEWLNFMNAGDRFVNCSVLQDTFYQQIPNEKEFIFSDWFLCNLRQDPEKLSAGYCNYKEGLILHQSVIYNKRLHNEYGKYLVTPKLIISDYLFFYLIPEHKFFKSKIPISINDNTGVSSASWTYQQKIAIDFVLGKYSFKQFLNVLLGYIRLIIKGKLSYLLAHYTVDKLKGNKM
jgi:glycosyltransferase involved in cell wall biosynthesis